MKYNMRVFVAINLPLEIKNKIEQRINVLQKQDNGAKFRWIRPENWHLTICFCGKLCLGNQKQEHILTIKKALEETTLNFSSPLINFESLSCGPKNKPYMIWLNTCKETSKRLSCIKEFLENKLLVSGLSFRKENREYNGHLTLAREQRVAKSTYEAKDFEEQFYRLQFTPSSLDLMESILKRGGVEYKTLFSVNFNGRKKEKI